MPRRASKHRCSASSPQYVIGLEAYSQTIKSEDAKLLAGLPEDARDKPFLDFRRWPLEGATVLDRYTCCASGSRASTRSGATGWQMPFMAPLPWEADAFYAQPGHGENGLSLDQWPVGTGPYMMREFVRDRLHVMERNPNYRGEPYPCEGTPQDKAAGLLDDCGKTMPFIDRLHVTIEKEEVPRKEKFKQGYFDVPEIERSEWGVKTSSDAEDSDQVRQFFEERGFKFPLLTDISTGTSASTCSTRWSEWATRRSSRERNRKLRQAIAIAIDWEEATSASSSTRAVSPHIRPSRPGCSARVKGRAASTTRSRTSGSGRQRQGRAAADLGGARAAGRGRLPRRPRRHRPASRWC
jgi:hypothetical protein